MKKLFFTFTLVYFSSSIAFLTKANDEIITNVVLSAVDMPGIEIHKITFDRWWYAWDEVNNKPFEEHEVTQNDWQDAFWGNNPTILTVTRYFG